MSGYETNLSPYAPVNKPNKFPEITKPNIIGFFSVDGNRQFIPNASNLKYLVLPTNLRQLSMDLNAEYENRVPKSETQNERIDHLLKFILENKTRLYHVNEQPLHQNDDKLLACDFICFRGLLRLLMCSPYDEREDWIIMATKYKGNIYLCQRETPRKISQRQNETESQKKILSYGFKFEQYIFTNDPQIPPNGQISTNEREEFCCMYKTTLTGMNIIFGAEVDGVTSQKKVDLNQFDPNQLEFVEAKLKLQEKHFRQKRNFLKYKSLNWWCQSFLVNIKRIIVGIRSESGFVFELEKVDVKNLQKMGSQYWTPAVCVKFLENFLVMVAKITKNVNCPDTVFEFYWNPSGKKNIKYNVKNGKNEFSFLPDWYVQNINVKN
ncbi:decapping nuclease DXO homolog [Condylostylus longicornis]|uniref:decapping nuclease DXO homolog n=1 Tax=Condylostylus longicornis TaxID=2530218 RepID=UPI00244DF829|nr:decapping nuclease DXO homolog [Condylostylus longicornis]